MRPSPAAPDQVLMPAQQPGRPHEHSAPAGAGQQPHEPGQDRTIGPVNLRPGHLASQYGHFVAKHKELGVLRRRAPRQQPKPPHHLAEQ